MRPIVLILSAWLGLTFFPGRVSAGESWVHVGDLHYPATGAVGKLSINLDSLRRRARHYEIWERVVFEVAGERPPAAEADGDTAERITLWAIRCGRGTMAKVTERVAGAFRPRAESLRFFIPAPGAAGAAVIEVACKEVRRRSTEEAPAKKEAADEFNPRLPLAPPGSYLDDDSLDDGDD